MIDISTPLGSITDPPAQNEQQRVGSLAILKGSRIELCVFVDGATKMPAVNLLSGSGTAVYQLWCIN